MVCTSRVLVWSLVVYVLPCMGSLTHTTFKPMLKGLTFMLDKADQLRQQLLRHTSHSKDQNKLPHHVVRVESLDSLHHLTDGLLGTDLHADWVGYSSEELDMSLCELGRPLPYPEKVR